MKRTLLVILTLFVSLVVAEAQQDYSKYYGMREQAVKLINQGSLEDALRILETIPTTCRGAIPLDNDVDALIQRCIVLSPKTSQLRFGPQDRTEQYVSVTTNLKEQFSASSSAPDWCKITRKVKDGLWVQCISDNTLPQDRTATITLRLRGKLASIKVTQTGGEAKLVVQPDNVEFTNERDSESVYVYTNAPSWSIDSVPDWIVPRIKADSLELTSLANRKAESREATFYVIASGKRVPVQVYQSGSDTLVSASCDKIVAPCQEGVQSFAVESNFEGWQVSSSDDCDWIEVWADQDSVRVKTHENSSLFSRQGRVRISAGTRFFDVAVHQRPRVSERPVLSSELDNNNANEIRINSFPEGLKVTVISRSDSTVHYTPFTMPRDFQHHTLQAGFDKKGALFNEELEEFWFEPGLRFATFTWSPKSAIGVMSGYVAPHSWGAYAHIQVNTPFVGDFSGGGRWLAGYNMTFGPVYQPRQFPYVGAYAGVGLGGYVWAPHVGLDYEAGVMGFYKNAILSLGFHTSRVSSEVTSTSVMIGVGGYLKRYVDPTESNVEPDKRQWGYCASDSRRWTSVNYVFRPKEHGKGVMIGDVGKERARAYFKGMYLQPERADSLVVKNMEAGFGILFTPVNGIIDMCVGVSAAANLSGLEKKFQGMGVELGTVINLWRIPLTVFLHESDLFGERHLFVDFGIGFHIGKFGKKECTYQ